VQRAIEETLLFAHPANHYSNTGEVYVACAKIGVG